MQELHLTAGRSCQGERICTDLWDYHGSSGQDGQYLGEEVVSPEEFRQLLETGMTQAKLR